MFQQFLAKGFCVIPLQKGIPQTKWLPYQKTLPSIEDAKKWDEAGHKEYALVCGEVSGVIGLDIDTNESATYYAIAGHTPLRKFGSKGFTAFYRYNGEKSNAWKAQGDIHPTIELLSNGRLTTIPPSPHREKAGVFYTWLESDSFENLPYVNPDIFTFLDAKFPKPVRINTNSYPVERDVSMDDAAEMLDYITSDCSRDDWIAIGMALRDEFGDAACALWHRWSAKAGKRYNHNSAQSAWRSFTSDGYTVGTIIHRAKENGWLPAKPHVEDFEIDLSYLFNKKKEEKSTISVGGLVGQVADWITASAVSPQPMLSLAAAITFVGMIKGHRVQHKIRGARSNILMLTTAPTGSGKDWPQTAIKLLMERIGMQKHIQSRPASGSGLLTGIQKGAGMALMVTDEFGRFIGNINGSNAQSYMSEIADYVIELYSSANKTFYGKQYANEKENPQVVIKNPHFCCLGSTVLERLKASFSSAHVLDGFINRWLMITSDEWPEMNFSAPEAIPQSLIDSIEVWMDKNPIAMDAYGNLGDIKRLGFTPEAMEIFLQYEKIIKEKMRTVGYPRDQLYVRNAENVVKLSLVLCDDDYIGTSEVNNAISIVELSAKNLEAFASGITDNQHEKDFLFVLDIIRKWPGITKSQLTDRTRKLNKRTRNDILEQLIEAGDITPEKTANKIKFTACVK